MYKNHTVGVVIPAYNEEGFVGEVIETLPDFVDRAYVIDDCSTDGTWDEILDAAEAENGESVDENGELVAVSAEVGGVSAETADSNTGSVDADGGMKLVDDAFVDFVHPIQHDRNRGVGGAIKTGYLHALDDDLDLVAVMGGDGQMRPEELDRFLDPIVAGEADYTKGNRLLDREFRRGMSSWRLLGNWILTVLTKIASGYWRTMDPQNGYTAISGEALETVEIERMYEDYGYCNDLLVRLNVHEQRVADVPRRANYGDETSSIRYHTYIPRVSAMLLRDFLWRLRVKYLMRRFHPLALLYGIGSLSAAAGLLGTLRGLAGRAVGSDGDVESDGDAPSSSGKNALLLVVGWIAMILAMTFDLEENADKEVRIERDE